MKKIVVYACICNYCKKELVRGRLNLPEQFAIIYVQRGVYFCDVL